MPAKWPDFMETSPNGTHVPLVAVLEYVAARSLRAAELVSALHSSRCQVESEAYTLPNTGRQDAVRKSDGIDQLKLTLSKRMQYDPRCDARYTRAIDAGISLAGEGSIGRAGAEPAVAG